METNPTVAILALAFVLCALCPNLATCDENEVGDLRKGIESLSNIMVKYQAEFDRKVKFVQLQEAIDEIDRAMLGYQGNATDKLPKIRSLNSDARLTYENCVAPVFEWCISINSTFDIFIPHIAASQLSAHDKDVIWNMTVKALESGLKKTAKSLDLLTSVQYKTAELKNLFKAILHDVHNDFGPDGFYGKEKAELESMSTFMKFIHDLFVSICNLIIGAIGKALGFKKPPVKIFTTEEKLNFIEYFFGNLTQKIENATKIVEDIESALQEDKTNLHKLRGVIEGANNNNQLLLMDLSVLRASFIPDIRKLKDQCTSYVNWHGYDAPFYERIKSRTRRSASSFCRVQRSNAKDMLAESGSSNSTQFQDLGHIIDQMDCGSYVPPAHNLDIYKILENKF